MKCNVCGQEVRDNHAFCTNCGAKIERPEYLKFSDGVDDDAVEVAANIETNEGLGVATNFEANEGFGAATNYEANEGLGVATNFEANEDFGAATNFEANEGFGVAMNYEANEGLGVATNFETNEGLGVAAGFADDYGKTILLTPDNTKIAGLSNISELSEIDEAINDNVKTVGVETEVAVDSNEINNSVEAGTVAGANEINNSVVTDINTVQDNSIIVNGATASAAPSPAGYSSTLAGYAPSYNNVQPREQQYSQPQYSSDNANMTSQSPQTVLRQNTQSTYTSQTNSYYQNQQFGQNQSNQYSQQASYGQQVANAQPQQASYGQQVANAQPQQMPYNTASQNQQYGSQPQYRQMPENQFGQQSAYTAQPTRATVTPSSMAYIKPSRFRSDLDYTPISAWGYVGYNILFCIPVIGLIIVLILACGATKNANLRSYSRSFLCGLLILLILLAGLIGLGIAFSAIYWREIEEIIKAILRGLAL